MSANEREGEDAVEPLLVTATVVARLLDISCRSLWRLRSASALPAPVKVGGAVRWRLDEIKKWIADGCPKSEARDNGRMRR
jgi:predicted DNA-binding transcriptional regulator AlpA